MSIRWVCPSVEVVLYTLTEYIYIHVHTNKQPISSIHNYHKSVLSSLIICQSVCELRGSLISFETSTEDNKDCLPL